MAKQAPVTPGWVMYGLAGVITVLWAVSVLYRLFINPTWAAPPALDGSFVILVGVIFGGNTLGRRNNKDDDAPGGGSE